MKKIVKFYDAVEITMTSAEVTTLLVALYSKEESEIKEFGRAFTSTKKMIATFNEAQKFMGWDK